MSTKIIRYVLLIACLTIFLTGVVYAQTQVWPGYHYNAQKTGQNTDSTDISGGNVGLVWVWPKAQAGADASSKLDTDWVVDDIDAANFVMSPGAWLDPSTNGLTASDAYETSFKFENVVDTQTKTVQWKLPTVANGGKLLDTALTYKVYVWIPADYTTNTNGYKNTTGAIYTVHDSFGRGHTYVLDQSDTSFAGGWRLLTTTTFSLDSTSYMELSNQTTDDSSSADYAKTIVVADAVRFELSTGQEIYASPASASMSVDGVNTPVAYVGTVESPYGTDGASPDSGGVYCVNADAINFTISATAATTLWQYPRKGTGRDKLEGPIEGGIYSSPTLGYIKDPADATKDIMALFVTGMDRQVYAFDASGVGTGTTRAPRLLWKGPGVTAVEDDAAVNGTWNVIADRDDAFGASFLSVAATNNPTSELSVTWNFLPATRVAAGEPNASAGSGWTYNVFVWIPATYGELRAKDAVYTITYGSPEASATAVVTVDLRSGSHNEAKWVKLGSYFNVSSVKLSNVSKDTTAPGSVVVADAVMIVPETIIPFGYCSPTVNRMGVEKVFPPATFDSKLYTLNAGGRLIAFNIAGFSETNKICPVDWIYPSVKSSAGSTNEADLGDMTSSVSFFKNGADSYIYLAGLSGNVRCLNVTASTGDPTLLWTKDLSGDDDSAGFSSSPTLDAANSQLYLGSIDGQVFALDMLVDGATKWTYPATGDTDIGAIRFSTAAYTDSTGSQRIWVGSADGSIYSFDAATGLQTSSYIPSNVGAAIEGSVALDRSSSISGPLMYTGTMSGRFRWFSANTGLPISLTGVVSWRTAASQLFSSPNITNTSVGSYVLIGGDDGRLYAFSENIHGGEWYGGENPFEFPISSMQETLADFQNADIQLDIFNKDFYTNSDNANPESSDMLTFDNSWIVSQNMKSVNGDTYDKDGDGNTDAALLDQLSKDLTKAAKDVRTTCQTDLWSGRSSGNTIYFEWGDSIYIIVWNLPPTSQIFGSNDSSKKNSIRFNFTSAAAGVSAGSAMVNVRVKTLKEYTILNKDKSNVPMNDTSGTPIKRCYAIAEVKISPTGSRPPSPGDGYTLNVEVKTKDPDPATALKSQQVVQLNKLDGSYVPTSTPQKLGINNPLGISTGNSATDVAWDITQSRHETITNHASHINGNPHAIMPSIDMGIKSGSDNVVAHGTSSPQHALGVMDRSAVGLSGQEISRFRIDGWDLVFRGGDDAIVNKMPWEGGAGSRDYPNIERRNMDFRSVFDDKNPDLQPTRLPAVTGTGWPGTLYHDTVFSQISVPRYQPANMKDGYRRTYNAYIDSDGSGTFNSGNFVLGRPTTFQEAYRRFRLSVKVPVDPNIVAEGKKSSNNIDIGAAGHGLGEPGANLGTLKEFSAYNTAPLINSWFKKFTVKNEGNVNLYNLRVNKGIPLYSDPINAFDPYNTFVTINGKYIVSSLDKTVDGTNVEPTDDRTTAGLGFTLTKARVGDASPTILTIPDTRKKDYYGSSIQMTPIEPEISVRIPVGQPIGTYVNPTVYIYSDLNNDESLDFGEPISSTSFALQVKVKESQITGLPLDKETDAASRYMVDTSFPKVSDTTPAAFRDSNGNVNLYWSSNRLPAGYSYPTWSDPNDPLLRDFAGAPWSINKAVLRYDNAAKGWVYSSSVDSPWWSMSSSYLYSGWPDTLMQFDPAAQVPFWKYGGSDTDLKMAKLYSPSIGRNVSDGTNWLTFVGTASVQKTDHTFVYENRVFYGKINDTGDVPTLYSTEIDPSSTHKYPSLASWGDDMWLFWQTKGAIEYSTNIDAARVHEPTDASGNAVWSRPATLRMPTSLSSISAPNAILRQVWGPSNPPSATPPKLLDVVFAGTNRSSRNSDIMLCRYAVQTNSGAESSPSRRSQPLPRVFNEILQRDSKYGFYTSNHMAWVRLNTANMTAVVDNWGGYDLAAAVPDLPYIHVVLGEGYTLANGYAIDYPAGTVVSATDGSITLPDGTVRVAAAPIIPEFDSATGVATYSYKNAQAETDQILGKTLVDFSGGIVRFTKPLKELKTAAGISRTNVYVDYTPQAMRLTTDDDVDNSPRAFIEKTMMQKNYDGVRTTGYNPGLCDVKDSGGGLGFPGYDETVDRLWVLWRKAGTGITSSTVYTKTYRVGIDLTKISGAPPIELANDGGLLRDSSDKILMTVTNNLGPWEVDRTGTKIYFTEADERYRSLGKYGSSTLSSLVPGPMTISYPYKKDDGSPDTKTITVYDVSWIPEVPEHSLFGYSVEINVNEGSIYAFADPDQFGTGFADPPSKIWVFWTSTRSGVSNLYWETVTPSLVGK